MKYTTREWITGIAIGIACGAVFYNAVNHIQHDRSASTELIKALRRDSLSRHWRDSVQMVIERKEDSTIETNAIYNHSQIKN